MEWFEALILGLLQGLTEYLPVSSSGHLAIGSVLFGIQGEDNLTFTIAVHVATVLSRLILTVCVALVIIGGIKRISSVAQVVVPFMALVYVVTVLIILLTHLGDTNHPRHVRSF